MKTLVDVARPDLPELRGPVPGPRAQQIIEGSRHDVPVGLPDGGDRDPAILADGLDVDGPAGPAIRGQVPGDGGVPQVVA